MNTGNHNFQSHPEVQNVQQVAAAQTAKAKVVDVKPKIDVSAAKKTVRVLFDKKKIEEFETALLTTPAPPQALTKERVLSGLAEQIKKARDAGHTTETISELLRAHGLAVSRSQVAKVLSQFKTKSASKKENPETQKIIGGAEK